MYLKETPVFASIVNLIHGGLSIFAIQLLHVNQRKGVHLFVYDWNISFTVCSYDYVLWNLQHVWLPIYRWYSYIAWQVGIACIRWWRLEMNEMFDLFRAYLTRPIFVMLKGISNCIKLNTTVDKAYSWILVSRYYLSSRQYNKNVKYSWMSD